MADDFSTEKAIGLILHEVARLLRRRFEEEAKTYGVTLPQWRVLGELYRQQNATQTALASCTDTDPMTMSGILDRLEKRGLVNRYTDPNDSRAKLASLTQEGQALYLTARTVGLKLYESALHGLSTDEREALAKGLGQVRDNLIANAAEQKEAV